MWHADEGLLAGLCLARLYGWQQRCTYETKGRACPPERNLSVSFTRRVCARVEGKRFVWPPSLSPFVGGPRKPRHERANGYVRIFYRTYPPPKRAIETRVAEDVGG